MDIIYETICENYVNGIEITKSFLKQLDITEYRIKKMVATGVLRRVSRGRYIFSEMRVLYTVAKRYIKNDLTIAKNCFLKILEVDSENFGAITHLFYIAIKQNDYDNALYYFDIMFKRQYGETYNDIRLYLYLLGFLTDVKDYQNLLNTISLEDILIKENNNNYKDTLIHNKIRKSIFTLNFKYSISFLNKMDNNIYNEIVKVLSIKAQDYKDNQFNKIFQYVNSKQFESAYELLKEEKNKLKNLNGYDLYIDVLEDLLMIKKTRKIPTKCYCDLKRVPNLIECFDYEGAYKENKNAIYTNVLLDKLLEEILNEIETIKIENIRESKKIESSSVSAYLYNNGLYQEVIEYYQKHVSSIRNLKDRDYALMGLSLLKLGAIRSGIKYLKVATNLSQLSIDSRYDFSQYILQLEKETRFSHVENKEDSILKVFEDIDKYNLADEGFPQLSEEECDILENTIDSVMTNKDIVILEGMNESKISMVVDLLNDCENIKYSLIGDFGEHTLALSYFDHENILSINELNNYTNILLNDVKDMDFDNAINACQCIQNGAYKIKKFQLQLMIYTYLFNGEFDKALKLSIIYNLRNFDVKTAEINNKNIKRLLNKNKDEDEIFELLKTKIHELLDNKSIVILNTSENHTREKIKMYCESFHFIKLVELKDDEHMILMPYKYTKYNNFYYYYDIGKKMFEIGNYKNALQLFLEALSNMQKHDPYKDILLYIVACQSKLCQYNSAKNILMELKNFKDNDFDETAKKLGLKEIMKQL